MKLTNLGNVCAGTAALACAFAIAAPQAQAGTLYQGWNYSIDRNNDGSGGALYEYRGLASMETEDQLFFAISGGLDYNENSNTNLTHGDLFLNFSGGDFASANGGSSMLAIKFAPNNDTDLAVGVYKDVTGGDLNDFATINHIGHNYEGMAQYYDYGWGRDGGNWDKVTNTYGTDLATRRDVLNYFYSDAVASNPISGNTPFMNAIQSGTKIGDITMLTKSTLQSQYGLNFGHFNAVGSDVFGFAIDKSMLAGVLPGGINDFMAHLILECGNDGIALAAAVDAPEQEEVPEPTALAALALVGAGMLGARKRR